jgi:hypothetical protein
MLYKNDAWHFNCTVLRVVKLFVSITRSCVKSSDRQALRYIYRVLQILYVCWCFSQIFIHNFFHLLLYSSIVANKIKIFNFCSRNLIIILLSFYKTKRTHYLADLVPKKDKDCTTPPPVLSSNVTGETKKNYVNLIFQKMSKNTNTPTLYFGLHCIHSENPINIKFRKTTKDYISLSNFSKNNRIIYVRKYIKR